MYHAVDVESSVVLRRRVSLTLLIPMEQGILFGVILGMMKQIQQVGLMPQNSLTTKLAFGTIQVAWLPYTLSGV